MIEVINQNEAGDFLDSLQVRDPIKAGMVRYAWHLLFHSQLSSKVPFDLLLYFQLTEDYFSNKQEVIDALNGIYRSDPVFGDEDFGEFRLCKLLDDKTIPIGTHGVLIRIIYGKPLTYKVTFPDGKGGHLGKEETYILAREYMDFVKSPPAGG